MPPYDGLDTPERVGLTTARVAAGTVGALGGKAVATALAAPVAAIPYVGPALSAVLLIGGEVGGDWAMTALFDRWVGDSLYEDWLD
jgi:hypothetical protein